MGRRLESVEITFENLDYIHIPVEYFGEFYITGIRTTVERLAMNVILQRTQAEHIQFALLARVDVAFSNMTQDLSFLPEEDMSLLKRIENRRDIVYLDLYYDDGSSDQFYLPWEDAAENRNGALQIAWCDNGDLMVTV